MNNNLNTKMSSFDVSNPATETKNVTDLEKNNRNNQYDNIRDEKIFESTYLSVSQTNHDEAEKQYKEYQRFVKNEIDKKMSNLLDETLKKDERFNHALDVLKKDTAVRRERDKLMNKQIHEKESKESFDAQEEKEKSNTMHILLVIIVMCLFFAIILFIVKRN